MDFEAPLGKQALEYADDYGYEVFPLIPLGEHAKSPATTNGMLDATTDLNQIRAWWERRPDALIGQRVPPDGLILDVDPRHSGMEVFKALKEEFGIKTSRVHMSGRGDGGGHLHFARPEGRLSTKKLDRWAKERGLGEQVGDNKWTAGIDLLHHDHRYTVLPPSPHPATGEPYFWRGRGPEDPPATLPEGVVDLLRPDETVEKPPPGPYDPNSIADWFSATQGFSWLAEEHWELVKGDGTSDGSAWRHPTATSAVSATVRHRCLFVYTNNTPFEITMPDDPAGYTPFRAWAILRHGSSMSAAARAARALKNQAERASSNGTGVGLGAISPQRVRWLWHPFLPFGKMVIHAGEPGLMKSSFDVAVAGALTTGKGFAEEFGPQRVVFLNYEDDDEDGLVPRLLAAGADLDLCTSCPDNTTPEVLAEIVEKVKPAAVFIDPFGSWAEEVDNSGVETQVRRSLKPLRLLARSSGALVKVNCHPNKQNSLSDALYRIAGSLGGMVGFARVVLASKRDEGHFVAGIVKSNIGPDELGVEYFSQFVPVQFPDGEAAIYPRVVFGDTVAIERKNFFASEKDEKPTKAGLCAEEIKKMLGDGQPRFTRDIKGLLASKFGMDTIMLGASIAGVETLGQGNGARWVLRPAKAPTIELGTQSVTVDITESDLSSMVGEVPQREEDGTV